MREWSYLLKRGKQRPSGASVALCHHAEPHPFILRAKHVPPQSLRKWIEFWKNHVTPAWPNRADIPTWQPEFWDRQLRRSESYAEKWQYVSSNPGAAAATEGG
jgi:hypothetical protein